MSGNKKKGLQSEDDPWPFGLGFEVRTINPQCKMFTDYRNRKFFLFFLKYFLIKAFLTFTYKIEIKKEKKKTKKKHTHTHTRTHTHTHTHI